MKKKIYLLAFLMSLSYVAAQQKDDLILKAANSELLIYLNGIPIGEENDFGFERRDEFGKIKFGSPIEIVVMDNKGIIHNINQFRVPIQVNQKNVGLLTVTKNEEGQYNATAYGASALSKKIESVEEKMNKKATTLLRLNKAQSDFISFDSDPESDDSKRTFFPLEQINDRNKEHKASSLDLFLSIRDIKNLFISN
ncbi:hypothetical protein D1631_04075 [Chryseobacterium nematophagum]|uniref:DUF4369 domain-containing protein n=1 Tax=Chryseobacterium nematophagum TaxID=2305228 RepID=A0A3M7TEU9_9FLAO|nr:hypothetical protein [Chryseobacterium nematophagum]RNA61169.1 hypothetical protein D1631_04075 [Chryseobacterium nematophagum]